MTDSFFVRQILKLVAPRIIELSLKHDLRIWITYTKSERVHLYLAEENRVRVYMAKEHEDSNFMKLAIEHANKKPLLIMQEFRGFKDSNSCDGWITEMLGLDWPERTAAYAVAILADLSLKLDASEGVNTIFHWDLKKVADEWPEKDFDATPYIGEFNV